MIPEFPELVVIRLESPRAVFDTRYTFLVNIWLGHTPLALEPLPDELLPSLSNERLSLQLSGRKPCPREAAQASGSRRFAATFGPSGIEHEVSFGWPPLGGSEDRNGDSCCTLEIDLGRAGAMGHIRAAPPPVLAQAPTIDAGEATWDSFLSLYRLHQVMFLTLPSSRSISHPSCFSSSSPCPLQCHLPC
jgi:hypothetical protein